MSDLIIKLFGKTISFPPSQVSGAHDCVAVAASYHDLCSASDSDRAEQELGMDQEDSIDQEMKKSVEKFQDSSRDEQEDATSDQITVKGKVTPTLARNDDNPRTPSVDLEASPQENSENGEEDNKTESDTLDKTLKKPDKILPCPRCNSMDTKFCYYNNYNANQPRHFCKNCQRYWTAGGTMRNVPVGAGRRKNKNVTASHYRHIMVSEALQLARMNAANGIHNPSLGNNGSVLTFGSDSPLGDNMASVFNLAEKSQLPVQNGFHRSDQRILVPCGGKDSGDDRSSGCGSSITACNSSDKVASSGLQEATVKNYQSFPPQVPCFPGPPWPCAWSPVPWNSTMHSAAFSQSTYPVSFYPAPAYWGCTGMGSWNMPLASPPDNSASNSTPSSTVLGKHSRDGTMLNPANLDKEEPAKESNNSGRSVWIPKTLRIDDPSEAAKSSIRATLGIWNEKTSSMSGGGLFESFQSSNSKDQVMGASAALHANPAALSRSHNFQENT